ncbi:AAA family ATPase [Halopelagius longus]|uniref:MoxR family ATPase n=1 Tax=Halopelagius longus TaxID=1236180 RepID=A0A1H1GKJ2_9EURY|nr:MoxR family ATPase [Halopelagius longus]RDI69687.1 MoxR family ATPase [Halopelagius longus]SDR13657.1 MoxR-like ATPase [Halopelagius longus]
MSDPAELYDSIREEVSTVLIGNERILEGLTVSLLTRGHLLLEGVPGIGKTMTANLFARATGLDYNRIQFTPDILPADITGTEIYREQTAEFEVRRGPVFSNLVVADEINRATPKAQSALLESMQERQVTIGGETFSLPNPFMVVATQNPIEMDGTFELPEAQRDRFQLKYTMEHLEWDDEREFIDRFHANPELGAGDVQRVVSVDDLLAAQSAVESVHVAEPVREFLLEVVTATRESEEILHGASTRATLSLLNATKAYAAIHGRNYVIPDDVLTMVKPAFVHRIILTTDAELNERDPADVLGTVVESVDPPEVSIGVPEEQ